MCHPEFLFTRRSWSAHGFPGRSARWRNIPSSSLATPTHLVFSNGGRSWRDRDVCCYLSHHHLFRGRRKTPEGGGSHRQIHKGGPKCVWFEWAPGHCYTQWVIDNMIPTAVQRVLRVPARILLVILWSSFANQHIRFQVSLLSNNPLLILAHGFRAPQALCALT